MKITLLGHASILVEMEGATCLMDPVFADPFEEGVVVSCPKRIVYPEKLPPVDTLIISHRHLDHLDIPSLVKVSRDCDVICTGGLVAPCLSTVSAYKNLRQAYGSLLLLPGLQLDFGKFVTQMGAEVIGSKDNWNYTRSLLYTLAIPYLHSGARLTYTVNDMLYIQGQANNGWNNDVENNNGKYYGVQLGVTPIKPLPIVLNYAVSSEPVGATSDALSLLDVVVTYNLTDSLAFMANYDNASQKQGVAAGKGAKWDGYALYARYAFMPTAAGVLRFEQFNDSDGFRTGVLLGNGGQKLTEETLTLEYTGLGAGSIIRLEYRHDSTNVDNTVSVFHKQDGTATQSQDTLTLGVVQTF